jgi:hypothetical protein
MGDLYDLVDEFKGAFAARIKAVKGTSARRRVRVVAEGYALEELKGLLDAGDTGDTDPEE